MAISLVAHARPGTPAAPPELGRSPSSKSAQKSVLLNDCTEKLRLAVQKAGGTRQVAARSGVALSTLGSYLAGGEMKLTTAMQLCSACDVSLTWLVEAGATSPRSKQADDMVSIRRAGGDSPEARPLREIMFSAAWLRNHFDRAPTELLAWEAQGAAMEPTVRQGDLLLVDTRTAAISSLDMHVIEVEGELLVRRLERSLDGGIVVRTDNHRFPPQTIAKDGRDSLRLVGRVVWKGSRAL